MLYVEFFHFGYQISKFLRKSFLFLRYFAQMSDLLFVLIIYAYLVFTNDSQLIFQLFSWMHEDLLNIIVTAFFDIMAHFDNELEMSPAIFKVISVITSSFFQYFDFLLNIDQIFVDSVDFLIPFERVDLRFDYGIFFRFIHLIETYLFSIEEIYLGLFSFPN